MRVMLLQFLYVYIFLELAMCIFEFCIYLSLLASKPKINLFNGFIY
ncbi:unnamed protein product [Arabidopsis halleri]